MIFLLKYQSLLDSPSIKAKYSAIYDGIYTGSKYALIYSTVFCYRRLYIVLINSSFNTSFPFTHFQQTQYFFKIIFFLVLQSVYIGYIYMTEPHILPLFN